jgi:hypothetical protein
MTWTTVIQACIEHRAAALWRRRTARRQPPTDSPASCNRAKVSGERRGTASRRSNSAAMSMTGERQSKPPPPAVLLTPKGRRLIEHRGPLTGAAEPARTELPSPAFWMARSQTERGNVRVTTGRLTRRVAAGRRRGGNGGPPRVDGKVAGRLPGDRRLSRAALALRVPADQLVGPLGDGSPRCMALPHTAACLWPTGGVDLSTVSAWLGHASISTTNRHLPYLETAADSAGWERLNRGRGAHGACASHRPREF